MDFGSLLESELEQEWRCGALKACMYRLKLRSLKWKSFKGLT